MLRAADGDAAWAMADRGLGYHAVIDQSSGQSGAAGVIIRVNGSGCDATNDATHCSVARGGTDAAADVTVLVVVVADVSCDARMLAAADAHRSPDDLDVAASKVGAHPVVDEWVVATVAHCQPMRSDPDRLYIAERPD